MIELKNPEALNTIKVLRHGGHAGEADGMVCARELIHLIVTGERQDATPKCLTVALCALPTLNDGRWRDDAHRTDTLMPYIQRLLRCERDAEIDQKIAFRLADLAVRTIAADALDSAKLPIEAANLRKLAPVTNKETAYAAYAAADAADAADAAYAAYAAADAAYAAYAAADAADAAYAAAYAADAAADAAYAAYAAADAIEKHSRAVLDIICECYGQMEPTP